MKKFICILTAGFISASLLTGCSTSSTVGTSADTKSAGPVSAASGSAASSSDATASALSKAAKSPSDMGTATDGTEIYRNFRVDDILHTKNNGDIHYSICIPEDYDGSLPYALFITLPGWEGLYFQGVGENLRDEEFAFEAEKYNSQMIIAAPQLNDWGETSADQTIALTEYLLQAYNIDRNRVYLEGYSGGGETGSLAVGKRPDLYTAWLMGSSRWDGDYDAVVSDELPVYLVVGENDSYYGSEPLTEAYNTLHDLYVKKGLSEAEIQRILVLDIKGADYFENRGFQDQHAGGQAFAKDPDIMGWLFRQCRS